MNKKEKAIVEAMVNALLESRLLTAMGYASILKLDEVVKLIELRRAGSKEPEQIA